MKFSIVASLALAATVNAHSIMQKVSINGADQGSLVGLRAPRENNPTYSVTDSNMICDSDGSTSSTVLNIKSGDKVGFYWGHVIGGAQFANDPDNPIASSHKGPIQVYFAKVSNAATTSKTGLSWFKVASEGLNGQKWGVDTMIQQGGWWYFTVPSCLAGGDYLARVELLALHNAYDSQGEQFYISCAQFRLTSSGSDTPSGVSFPGAYAQNDPGILINIYSGSSPYNGGKAYKAPGPAVYQCGSNPGSSTPTTTSSRAPTATTTSSRAGNPTTTAASNGGSGTVAQWQQCGGASYTGATGCVSPYKCVVLNAYYSQCQ